MATSKFVRTPTAQAAAPKARVRKPQAQRVAPETVQPAEHGVGQDHDEFELPSSTKVFVSTMLGLGTYGASFYGTMSMVNTLSTAVMALTGVGFISFMVWFLGAVIAIVSSLRLGYFVASKVLGYQPGDFAGAGESVKRAAASKVSLVRGWFAPDQSVAA